MDTNDTLLQDFLSDMFAPAYCPANPVDDDTAKVDPFAYLSLIHI